MDFQRQILVLLLFPGPFPAGLKRKKRGQETKEKVPESATTVEIFRLKNGFMETFPDSSPDLQDIFLLVDLYIIKIYNSVFSHGER